MKNILLTLLYNAYYYIKYFFAIIVSVCTLLSLMTYDMYDPSLNVAAEYLPHNLLGYSGASVADILIQTFGIFAWIIPFYIGYIGINGVFNIQNTQLKFDIIYLLILIICVSTTFELCLYKYNIKNQCSCGVVAILISNHCKNYHQYLLPVTSIVSIAMTALIIRPLKLHVNKLLCSIKSLMLHFNKKKISIPAHNPNVSNYSTSTASKENYANTNVSADFKVDTNNINFNSYNQNYSTKTHEDRQKIDTKQFDDKNIKIQKSSDLRSANAQETIKTTQYLNVEQKNGGHINIHFDKTQNDRFYLPSIDLLNKTQKQNIVLDSIEQLQENANELIKVLNDFGVKGKIIDIHQGPVVTLYEFEPAAGTKSSRVIGLADDIARSLCAISTRISTVPGRNVLGIELPNKERMFFNIHELINTDTYQNPKINLPIILGKELSGQTYVVDLAKMPHLLVAGTTGSGKSVAINAMILSLLYKHTPAECRFIMIDPKMLELSVYDDIPHLLTPVVTEPHKAITALKWAVKEMENRYRKMSSLGVRNIYGYNNKIEQAIQSNEVLSKKVQIGFDNHSGTPIYDEVIIASEKLPFIVIIVDEMADLMLVAGKDIEASIQRLAQMARAAGIHLIMATQRPSVDVITGVIKANFPSRISFKVTSKIDSRTILGQMGSEQLLGMGDMLYMGNASQITRVHGPFVDDREVEKVAEFLKAQGPPDYINSVTENTDDKDESSNNSFDDDEDSDLSLEERLYQKAIEIVKQDQKVSTSYLQRTMRIGYNRAAIIVDRLEKEGIISSANHIGKREVLLQND